jgi:hypothetical protein
MTARENSWNSRYGIRRGRGVNVSVRVLGRQQVCWFIFACRLLHDYQWYKLSLDFDLLIMLSSSTLPSRKLPKFYNNYIIYHLQCILKTVEQRLVDLEKELQEKQRDLDDTQKRLDDVEKKVQFCGLKVNETTQKFKLLFIVFNVGGVLEAFYQKL